MALSDVAQFSTNADHLRNERNSRDQAWTNAELKRPCKDNASKVALVRRLREETTVSLRWSQKISTWEPERMCPIGLTTALIRKCQYLAPGRSLLRDMLLYIPVVSINVKEDAVLFWRTNCPNGRAAIGKSMASAK